MKNNYLDLTLKPSTEGPSLQSKLLCVLVPYYTINGGELPSCMN